MTMDVANQNRPDLKMPSPRISDDLQTKTDIPVTIKNTVKRSFDVAFLMMPDDKMKQKHLLEKQARIEEIDVTSYPSELTIRNDLTLRHIHHDEIQQMHNRSFHQFETKQKINNNNNNINNNNNNNCHGIDSELVNIEQSRPIRFSSNQTTRPPRIYDDPTILPSSERNSFIDLEVPRSAFTKVPHARLESPIPPSSPDQMSCPSNSPPISLSPPRNHVYANIRPDYHFINGGAFQPIVQIQNQNAQNNKLKNQFIYRAPNTNSMNSELPPGYIQSQAFPFNGNSHPFVPQPDITGIVRYPAAAAILSTLIPPTLASTFSLAAQNVCAKCNINFRMTSDLVYHMRSHHKNDLGGDQTRRKREEKLKCPVCNESFRERHHLTRHMTAHQDKDGDDTDLITAELSRRHKP